MSKSQVREVYQSVVASPESPTDEEFSTIIDQLEAQYKAIAFEPTTDLGAVEHSVPIPAILVPR